MLFGAGILLMSRRMEARSLKAARYHYGRSLWGLAIGALHAYLLWYGDILFGYALLAMIVFHLRKASPRKLIIIGFATLAVPSLLYLFFGSTMRYWPPEGVENLMKSWMPGPELIRQQVEAFRGGWLDQMSQRVPVSAMMQSFFLLMRHGWRNFGVMCLGMALVRVGFLKGAWDARTYLRYMLVGFGVGIPLVAVGVWRNFAAGWSVEYSMFLGVQFNMWGSLGVALGYVSLIMLVTGTGALSGLTSVLARAGRMAFSNYLGQTLICTTVFYGHGLGLFGTLERWQQILMVFAIWAFQLVFSWFWLGAFRFGPAEWVWRSLTYMKPQPMRRS
jgi:uncharacterized protein